MEMFSASKSESLYHKATKELFFKYVSENDPKIIESSKEVYVKNRRLDVCFTSRYGEKIAIEVQNSYISAKEIKKRTQDYSDAGIYVLWVLNGKGKCVGSEKTPEDKKEVKINPTENFLHRLYGGRVYYTNLNNRNGKLTITPPFVLHFSLSNKKKHKDIKKDKYIHFFVRNVTLVRVPGWSILCTNSFAGYGGKNNNSKKYLIARFNDKSATQLLKLSMLNFAQENKGAKNKKLLKKTQKQFKKKYSKPFIRKVIAILISEKKVNIDIKYLDEDTRKYYYKYLKK